MKVLMLQGGAVLWYPRGVRQGGGQWDGLCHHQGLNIITRHHHPALHVRFSPHFVPHVA